MGDSRYAALGEDVFEVEKILRKRRHPTKGYLFLVKWRNFPTSDNTWEPACNFSQDLIDDFELNQRNKRHKSTHQHSTTTTSTTSRSSPSKASSVATTNQLQPTPSSSSSTTSSLNSRLSSSGGEIGPRDQQHHDDDASDQGSSSAATTTTTTGITESRVSRKLRRDQRRQQQVKLQLHIQQQQQKFQAPINRQQLAVFNPNGTHRLPIVEEVVYEPKLTKEPIIVTDVTSKDSTVTISECKTPEGFFSVNTDCWNRK